MATGTRELPWILTTVQQSATRHERWDAIRKKYNVVLWKDFTANLDTYKDKIEAIVVSPLGMPTITEEVLRKMSKLKVLATTSAGTDHLDLPMLRRLGIKIGHAPDVVTDPCADFGFGLLLAAARRIPENMAISRGYTKTDFAFDVGKTMTILGQDVCRSTLGIIGMGRIGFELARRASGFRMRTLYYNRNRRTKDDENEVKATYCSTLEALLPQVDFLVLTAPLNDSTEYMIRAKQFRMMKPTSIIINIARGPLIDHNDLLEALKNGTISGAALDTTDPEPLSQDHPLLTMPNVILTPHVGTFTLKVMLKIYEVTLNNIAAGIAGRNLPSEVPIAQ